MGGALRHEPDRSQRHHGAPSGAENFLFLNGFSRPLQQAVAMGRGTAEFLMIWCLSQLDLTPFHYDRIIEDRPMMERAVI